MPRTDEDFMRRALALAKLGWGKTTPNPMVGAVLVKNGEIIGEGWHRADGMPHAEIECLRAAKKSPEGATLYVTLEPCSTRGRTGACTEAITAAKIAEVKIGALDPNPAHSGRAPEIFRARNIACETGILGRECEDLNFIFNHIITRKTALIALKYAQSADGKIALKRGERTMITGAEVSAEVMEMRRLFSAIGVGRGTLEADNPALTSRMGGSVECTARLIFDPSLKIARNRNLQAFAVFSDEFKSKTRVVCDVSATDNDVKFLSSLGIASIRVGHLKTSPEFWRELALTLYGEKLYSLYIEGGAAVLESLRAARAADYAFEYTSKKLLGGFALPAFENGRDFDIDGSPRALGEDSAISGKIIWKPRP